MNKSEYVEFLKKNVALVKFTKTDGVTREMKCTLIQSYLPQRVETGDATEVKKTKAPNDSVVNAWDVEKLGWRSFVIANVISMEAV